MAFGLSKHVTLTFSFEALVWTTWLVERSSVASVAHNTTVVARGALLRPAFVLLYLNSLGIKMDDVSTRPCH
ncbi:hypothetical protein DFH06DRAFT_1167139 [Mycena polygramma]|nr:hypothetical protein DFH06DRAFT_1167139 [Mycena polygramma]